VKEGQNAKESIGWIKEHSFDKSLTCHDRCFLRVHDSLGKTCCSRSVKDKTNVFRAGFVKKFSGFFSKKESSSSMTSQEDGAHVCASFRNSFSANTIFASECLRIYLHSFSKRSGFVGTKVELFSISFALSSKWPSKWRNHFIIRSVS
jgi:hypothetical protein